MYFLYVKERVVYFLYVKERAVYFLYVNPFRSSIVPVYYVVLIRPIFLKRHCILICVCGPVVGLGLYDDAPDTCSATDDCGAYVNDRERELYCLCCIVVGGLRKGWRNCLEL